MEINYKNKYLKYRNKYSDLKLTLQQGGYLPKSCIKNEPVCIVGKQGTEYDEYMTRVYANTECDGTQGSRVYLDDGNVLPNSTINNYFYKSKCPNRNTAIWSTIQKDTISYYVDKKGYVFNLDGQLINKKDINKKYRIDKISITGLVYNITSASIDASSINNPEDKIQLSTDEVIKNYYITKPSDKIPLDILSNVDIEIMQNYIAKKTHS
jgi:hypothetical protein